MQKTSILVDWQNQIITDVAPLLQKDASAVTLRIFCGNLAQGVPKKIKKVKEELGDRCEIYPAAGREANAVDMLIAYHIGENHIAYKNERVILLTNDRDFDTLVAAAHQQGVKISKYASWAKICKVIGLDSPVNQPEPKDVPQKKAPSTQKKKKVVKKSSFTVPPAKRLHHILVDSAYCTQEDIPLYVAQAFCCFYGDMAFVRGVLEGAAQKDGPFTVISPNFEYNSLLAEIRQKNSKHFVRRLNSWDVALTVLAGN